MKVITLKRVVMNQQGTWGVLIDGNPFCVTIELPDKNNARDVSCIPSGEYLCQRVVRIRMGECWEVLQVPNRDSVLIHRANFTSDLRGCIGVGEEFSDVLNPAASKVETAVLASGRAFSELMQKLIGQNQFKLVIVEV